MDKPYRLLLYVSVAIGFFHSNVSGQKKAVNETKKDCADEENCEFYWSRGWYTCGVGAVLYNICKKKCKYCDKVPIPKPDPKICKDYEPQCRHWAKYFECIHKRKFMMKYCKKSCGWCPKDETTRKKNQDCVNKHYTCQSKAQRLRCLFNRKYMSQNCMKSCKMCSLYSKCIDKDSLCNWWKQRGFCHAASGFQDDMAIRCPFSCEYCIESTLYKGKS